MRHAPFPKAQGSLARSTLIKMGVRIAVIITLATFFSYFHIFRSFRTEALEQMEGYLAERGQREQAHFVLAQDNHSVIKKALAERFQAWSQRDPDPHFDRLFARLPDGTIRNEPRSFDGRKMPGVFVPRGVTDDADFRRRLLAAYEVVAQYGPAFHIRFANTGVILPEGVLVGYWPGGATWFQDVAADFSLLDFEYFTLGLPEKNLRRESAWTGIFEDTPSKTWMVTVATPLDVDGRHVATITHDMLLDELMRRTIGDHPPGTYNVLFRDDGLLIAHPELKVKSGAEPYNILNDARKPEAVFEQGGTAGQLAHLRGIVEQVRARPEGQNVLELSEHGEYIAVVRLKGPGWNLVTVLPEQVVSARAFDVARYVLMFGLASLLMELGIMYWVLKQQITRPLLTFTRATDQVAAGDFKVKLESSRDDELGRLANAFQLMAQEVQHREDALRQANEGLEKRVEERTRELQEVHRQLVETARQVGRAEVATNVLHNVGNVLNSVHTSALLARERLAGLKLEGVERLGALFEEHRADLATFLTQDERGRNALPYLSQLGTHLMEGRQELQALLNDVGKHTEHIGAIVKLQQRYARTPQHMFEPVQLEELVEDALRINQAALGRHCVTVERNLAELPPILTERHKVLMILVNLISNAKYAMDAVSEGERRLCVKLERLADNRVRIEVRDNGVGIAPDMLTRIFQHGFTTREEGNGFGLHSSALAAQELGGTLRAQSEGPGKGATFTLELPEAPEKNRMRLSA
ncbi:ATP-binding protein [Archangium lipolyticum]|uniref:ATP-binding protein n=1 Tax=Archangium lipolyticum TaxID=2970465 RepID=UPI002149BB1C|nr:ATP-binding protein [Archangium lipolyticum]